MGYYADTVRAQTPEDYVSTEDVTDILFNVTDLALALKDISARLIWLEQEVQRLGRPQVIG